MGQKLNEVAVVKGEFRLFIRNPRDGSVMALDDRWKVTKVDETHYQVAPSLNYGPEDQDYSFHTTNPFTIEIEGTNLTPAKREHDD